MTASGRTGRAGRRRRRHVIGRACDRVAHARVLDRRGHDVPPSRRRTRRSPCSTDSVPDDVNTTSRGRAPKNAATCSRAFSSATRVARPSECKRPGSPNDDARTAASPASATGRSGAGRRVIEVRARAQHARDAVLVAAGPALGDLGLGLAVEPFEHALHHAGVDRAQHVRVLPRGFAERAVLRDERERVAARLRRARRTRARSARRRPTRPRPSPNGGPRSVPCAPRSRGRTRSRPLRRARGPRRSAAVRARGRAASRAGRRGAGGNERCVSLRGGAVALRRPARGLVPSELDVEVAAGRELLEVVAGHVGMQREMLGDLGRLDAVGRPTARRGRCRAGSGRRTRS